MDFDDFMGDGQAQSCSMIFFWEERIEDMGEVFGVNAAAGIGDGDDDYTVLSKAGIYSQCTAIGHGLYGIEKYI